MNQRIPVFTSHQLARIEARWPSAHAYYAERDDRTSRLVSDLEDYSSRQVEIHIDPAAATSQTVQRIALIASNLTARWARHIRIVMPENIALTPELRRGMFTTLNERLQWEMSMADPFGNFTIVTESDDAGALRLFIGPWSGTRRICGDDYQVHAASWTALGRRASDSIIPSANVDSEATVAASGLTGSLGACDLFKRAVGHERIDWMATFSWDMRASLLRTGPESWRHISAQAVPTVVDLHRMFLGGVGAIGSAFIYLADLGVVNGDLMLLDRDTVDVTNLNRSPLFTAIDALGAVSKTAAAASYLGWQPVDISRRDGTWHEHAKAVGEQAFDLWISLTNEDGAWAELPFQLPPVVLHATTTSEWGLGAGRHIPRVEDCTLCRMPRPAAEFRGPCAQGKIDERTPEIRASLPFLSAAAASLLLGMYMQVCETREAHYFANDISTDLRVGLRALVVLHRRSTPGCRGCRAVSTKAWSIRGGRGVFAHWSAG